MEGLIKKQKCTAIFRFFNANCNNMSCPPIQYVTNYQHCSTKGIPYKRK